MRGSAATDAGHILEFTLKLWRRDGKVRWELKRLLLASGNDFTKKWMQPHDVIINQLHHWLAAWSRLGFAVRDEFGRSSHS